MEKTPPKLSRTVYVLSYVSLFADIASELLYPILPIYLQSIGFNTAMIGLLEGVADLVAGLSKSFFGRWSDVIGRRMPFVWTGYFASILSKGLIGIFVAPAWIFFCRTVDRLGKGVRTGARDAILADEAGESNKGAVFGFHRAMDTTGAFIGPILALVYLMFYPGDYRNLFLIALLPIFAIVPLLKLVPEKKRQVKSEPILKSSFSYWKRSTPEYQNVLLFVGAFTLLNSSDVFLLLKAKEILTDDRLVVGCYIFYNLIYASSSFSFGKISDKIGKGQTFTLSLFLFAGAYLMMGYSTSFWGVFAAFLIYGLFSGASEGTIKAWVSSHSNSLDRAEALGFQGTTQSICALLASIFAGFVWTQFGSHYVFLYSGLGAIFLAILARAKFRNLLLG